MTEPEEERSEQATIIFKKKRKEGKKERSEHPSKIFVEHNRGGRPIISLGGGAGAATATPRSRRAAARVPS